MQKPLCVATVALINNLALCPAALSQITSVTVETFPMEAQTPYDTFTTPQPAIVTIQTNSTLEITLSPVVADGFTDPAGTVLESYALHEGVEDSNGTLEINDIGTVTVTIDVGMSANRREPYPAGTYKYVITLTIAPL